ncbi:MAG TPA: rRNA maturation RNase YbeY [Candidatus Dormibacteraeota bacterium]|nr:rRNA maturation RNase YbeY [Candidatus Dormibacteraeota bacterium]
MIYLSNHTRGGGVDATHVRRTVRALLAALGETGSSVSITFVRDPEMRALNREHRGKDRATDVLSFSLVEGESAPAAGERMLGDVVISVDAARRQADEYDAPVAREIERLLIHSLLHLLGHDHLEAEERARMVAEERRLAAAIGMPWAYEPGEEGQP